MFDYQRSCPNMAGYQPKYTAPIRNTIHFTPNLHILGLRRKSSETQINNNMKPKVSRAKFIHTAPALD